MRELAAACVAAAGILTALAGQAGDSPQHGKPVILNVVATDHAGRPVTYLKPGDLRVLDDGAQRQITSLRRNTGQPHPVLLILLDQMDLDFQQAGYHAEQLRRCLAALTRSDTVYLYLLAANGSLYPVHAVPDADGPRSADDAAWVEHADALLSQALSRVNQARAVRFISHAEERFKLTGNALASLEEKMSRLHGRKQLIWITDGIPSSIHFGQSWVSLTPRLRQLGAQFNRDGIAIYTLDPSLGLSGLSREGMEILSRTTGGRTFVSSDLKTVLRQARMDLSASYLLEYRAPPGRNSAGEIHTVRLTCNRKGVRLLSQEAYFAEVEPLKAVAAGAPLQPAPVAEALPPELGQTFAGIVRQTEDQSMVLELDDTRFIMVDFRETQQSGAQTGDRVKVRASEYDGHGLVGESVSIVQAAIPAPAVTPRQAKPQMEADPDPVLKHVRETEAAMDRALPNFLCREVVQRYEDTAGLNQWELQDTLSAEVLYSHRTGETYRDIRVNGRPTRSSWRDLSGDISTGEFGSLLHSLLSNPDAAFQFVKEANVDGMAAREYSFHVGRAQSDWKILSDYQFIIPRYSGRVWFDRDGKHVLRIERKAEGIPSEFPLSSVEAEINFAEVRLGSSETYLLPTQAETRVCIRGGHRCSRKTIDFREYKQFTGESKITF